MGRNKSLTAFGGAVFTGYDSGFIAAVIRGNNCCQQIRQRPIKTLDARLVEDIIPRPGASSGIHAGLAVSSYRAYLCWGLRYAFSGTGFTDYLLQQAPGYDVVVPRRASTWSLCMRSHPRGCPPELLRSTLKQGKHKTISFLSQGEGGATWVLKNRRTLTTIAWSDFSQY